MCSIQRARFGEVHKNQINVQGLIIPRPIKSDSHTTQHNCLCVSVWVTYIINMLFYFIFMLFKYVLTVLNLIILQFLLLLLVFPQLFSFSSNKLLKFVYTLFYFLIRNTMFLMVCRWAGWIFFWFFFVFPHCNTRKNAPQVKPICCMHKVWINCGLLMSTQCYRESWLLFSCLTTFDLQRYFKGGLLPSHDKLHWLQLFVKQRRSHKV